MEQMDDVRTADPEKLQAVDETKAVLEQLPIGQWTIATRGRYRTATNRLSHVRLPIPGTIVTADDIENRKPAPYSYLLAAERLGVAPDDCVVVEDAPARIEGALRAGAFVIGIATPSPPAVLAGGNVVVQHPSDVQVVSCDDGSLYVERKEDR